MSEEKQLEHAWMWFSDRIQDNPSAKFDIFELSRFDDLVKFIVDNQLPDQALERSEIISELYNIPHGVQSNIGGLVITRGTKAY